MILAGFSSLEKSYPSRKILKGASGAIKNGERIAFLGSNGTGKTTLLEILAGKIDRDKGSLDIPKNIKRGYLPQEATVTSDLLLFDYAVGGLERLVEMRNRLGEIHHQLEKQAHKLDLLEELGKLQHKFEESGGYVMEARAREVLAGLGFVEIDQQKKLNELSGGMQNRAALARLLIGEPDLLLLDEPTNHLDIAGFEFLESYLSGFEGGVIYVSHDRAFIKNTATAVWELIDGRIVSYSGKYDRYLVEREKRITSMAKNYESQKEFIARTEDYIRRNIVGQKTKQAQSRRRMLARMERLEKPPGAEDTASINFKGAGRSTRIVVKCENASFSYDETPLLGGLNFVIERGERIGLFGPNGSGKTTVLKLILGKLESKTGTIELGKKLSIGYYDQQAADLDSRATPISIIREVKPKWTEPQIRSYLGRFLFRGEDVWREVGTFSGGEQSRLVLARIIVTEPNFLVLDEPTNHLDIQSREGLEESLAEYGGTVLCISHDREFLDGFAEKIFSIEKGRLRIFLGNYSDYKEKLLSMVQPSAKKEKSTTKSKADKVSRKSVNPQIIAKAETEISDLEKSISDLEAVISQHETSSNWEKIWALVEQRNKHYSELESLYEKLENLKSPGE
ncbi:MAG: ABC-F family ATP-binding cassette domain-containing protein [candidate division Zixibacteria bacterium]